MKKSNSLNVLKINFILAALTPVLWLQSRQVRQRTPRLPEATGPRKGRVGTGELIKVLVLGDSGAAGVGVQLMDEGLCGQLVARLSHEYTVEWVVLATNGLDSPGMIKLIEGEPYSEFDVVVVSLGANDATALCAPDQWSQMQESVADLIKDRFNPRVLVHSAVPPMHACMALPQPLRWFMGCWANEMNGRLADSVQTKQILSGVRACKRSVHWHPETTTTYGMSEDGIHPSALGYSVWAQTLSTHIRANLNAR